MSTDRDYVQKFPYPVVTTLAEGLHCFHLRRGRRGGGGEGVKDGVYK